MNDQVPIGTIYQVNHSQCGIKYKVFNGTDWVLVDQVDQNSFIQVRNRARDIIDQHLCNLDEKSQQYDDPFGD